MMNEDLLYDIIRVMHLASIWDIRARRIHMAAWVEWVFIDLDIYCCIREKQNLRI